MSIFTKFPVFYKIHYGYLPKKMILSDKDRIGILKLLRNRVLKDQIKKAALLFPSVCSAA